MCHAPLPVIRYIHKLVPSPLLGREQHVDVAARHVHRRQRGARALVGGVGHAGRVRGVDRRRGAQAPPERVVPLRRRRRRPLRRGALRRRARRPLRPLRARLARRREAQGLFGAWVVAERRAWLFIRRFLRRQRHRSPRPPFWPFAFLGDIGGSTGRWSPLGAA